MKEGLWEGGRGEEGGRRRSGANPTQKGDVGAALTDEFDEGLSQHVAPTRVRCEETAEGEDRVEEANEEDDGCLHDKGFAAKARQSVVPQGSQQLLAIGVPRKL